MSLRQALAFFFLHCTAVAAFGQDTYPLANNISIQVCEGFLTDSDAGLNGQDYGHGENYTFTTCISGADSIRITFFNFCSEAGYDVMTFYDGPTVGSPQIGAPHSGQTLPGAVTATSGCLTIAWQSDVFGVACAGWNAYWQTYTTAPDPPQATFAPAMPTCSTAVVTLNFSNPVPCDSVVPAALVFAGQVSQTVTSATPLNCVNGMGTSYQIELLPGLDASGSYTMEFAYTYIDLCGEAFVLEAEGTLVVNDCPLQVELMANDDALCPGGCTEVWADVTGGDPSSYVFAWSGGLPNTAGPHLVCPLATTTYVVTVSDASAAPAASAQHTITLLALPALMPAGPVCENAPALTLSAMPAAGSWSGSHMTNAQGLFEPDTGAGMPWAVYTAPNGCADSMQVTVFQVWAGFNEASCPNAAPFALSNAVPVGGLWSGSPFVSANGTFAPSTVGVHNVTYTTTDGCTSTKQVAVDAIAVQADATVCESANGFALTFSPLGGSWSGAGVANWYWGWYEPSQAGGGVHTLTYAMNGCSQTVDMTVTAINAGNDRSVCPAQTPFQLNANPGGGTWSGTGVSATGLFNPSVPTNGADVVLSYSLNGCTDQRTIAVRQTTIAVAQAALCPYDESVALNQSNTGRFPGGGNWSGPGTYDDNGWQFSPAAAGPGVHTIYYTANTCTDSMVITINENTMFDTLICETGNPIALQALPAGGLWYGEAITDSVAGIFNPQLVGAGLHWNYYLAPTGCWDSLAVNVYSLEPATITGLASTYCFADSAFVLQGYPQGGAFSGPGAADSTFNPATAGQGIHTVRYMQGAPGCVVQAAQLVSVSAPIVTITSGDTALCPNQAITLNITATGGNGSPLQYAWNPDVTYFSTIEVYPNTTTTYHITTTDGCSTPALDSITVAVQPPFSATITTSNILCYGEQGYATATGTPQSGYRYAWNTTPPTFGQTIYGPSPSFYTVTLTNVATGCTFDTSITIPSYPSLVAFFTPNPNGDCLGESSPVAQFIDLSQGAFSGQWDFGDGTTQDYFPGEYPSHTYADTGHYPVTLTVQNELGTCTDAQTFDICVASEFTLFIPSAFTPDGDGLNDFLEIVSSGITNFEFIIYSRWGIPLHTQTSADGPFWDGKLKGEVVQQGTYSYWVYARALDKGSVRFIKEGGFIIVLPRQ